MKKSNYISWLKGIACLLIIIVHSPQCIEDVNNYIVHLTRLGRWGCQLFFLISGYLYTKSWNKDSDIFKFYKKRFVSLIPMYWIAIIFWCGIYYFYRGNDYCYPFVINFKGIILNVLLLHGFSNEYINSVVPGGWYIGTFSIMIILFPFIMKVYEKCLDRTKQLIPYIIAIISIIVQLFVCYCKNDFSLCRYSSFMNLSVINQLVCFMFGISLFYNLEDLLRKSPKEITFKLVGFGCVSVGLFYGSSFLVFFTMLTNITFVLFFKYLFIFVYMNYSKIQSKKYSSIICEFGDMSYEVYFINFVVTMLMPWALFKILDVNYNGTIIYIFSLIGMIVLTYVLSKFLYKINTMINLGGK